MTKDETSNIINMFQQDLLLDVSRHLGGLKVSVSVTGKSINIEKSHHTAFHNLNIALKAPSSDERSKTIVGFAILNEIVSDTIQSSLNTGTKSILGSISRSVFVSQEQLKINADIAAENTELTKEERARKTANAIRINNNRTVKPLNEIEIDIYGVDLIISFHSQASLFSKFSEIDSMTSPFATKTVITRRIRFLSTVSNLHFTVK